MNPFVFIPENPRWSNYVDIWTKIRFAKFVENTGVSDHCSNVITAFDKQFCRVFLCKTAFPP